MMKAIKKFIILIIIIIVVLLSIIFIINNTAKNDNENLNTEPGNESFKPTYSVSNIRAISSYETINNCVNKYMEYIRQNNIDGVYSVLNKNYITENKITKENVLRNVIKINYESEYMTKNAFEYSADLNIETYFTKGYILNKDDKTKQEYNFVINIDRKNKSYEIAQLEKTYTKYINIGENNIEIKDDNLKNEIINIGLNDFNNVEIVNGIRSKADNGILF